MSFGRRRNEELDYIVSRMKNAAGAAEGTLLPPRFIGGTRVPLVRGLRITRTETFTGGTVFTIAFTEPDDPQNLVSHYNVYAKGILNNNFQPIGMFSTVKSPAEVRVTSDARSRVTITVQTVLKNGQQSNIDESPTVTGISAGPTSSTSVSALTGSQGQLITFDATNSGILFGPGSSNTVLHGNGAATPTFSAVSLTSDVTGTLPVANGGTNKTSWTAGSIIFAGSGGTSLTEDNTGLFYDDANNRLGIGTAAPGHRLHVKHDQNGTSAALFQNSDTTDTNSRFQMQIEGGTTIGAWKALHGDNVYFGTGNAAAALVFQINSVNKMFLDTDGDLGIGTNSPTGRFDIAHTGAQGGAVVAISRSDSGNSNGSIRWRNSTGSYEAGIGSNFNVTGAGNLEFLNGSATKMILSDTGKLGIGTTSPSARLHSHESTLGNEVNRLSSSADNDDPAESVFQNRVATTDATTTTLHTIAIPSSTTVAVEAVVIARRTGGTAGSAEDGARYKLSAVYKNLSGTATIIGIVTKIADEDQPGWDANLTPSGGNVLIEVTGALDNNITWHVTLRTYSVST